MKRIKRIIASILMLSIVFSAVYPQTAYAAPTVLSAEPYIYLETDYSEEVECGTIRYISQIKNDYFYYEYWGSWASDAITECATSCISMALSYVGLDKTPEDILNKNNGLTYWVGWGADVRDSRSDSKFTVEQALENYFEGEGKYSPPILHFKTGGTYPSGHFMLLAGVYDDGSYLLVDPGTRRVTQHITEEDALYHEVDRVIQYYNKDAVLDDKHEHTWGDTYILDREATCEREGQKSIHCTACDGINGETIISIPKTQHNYSDWVVDKKATCTEDGYKSIHCSICDGSDETTVQVISATGHNFGEWTLINDATYTETGKEVRTCENCGYEESRIIDTYKIESITLNKTSVEIIAGKTITLEYTCQPIEPEDEMVTWTCSNGSVASVDSNGNVKALGAGSAVITVSVSGKTASCQVTVLPKRLSSGSVNYTDVANNAWYYDSVEYVASNGLMVGIGDTTFGPNSILSRPQFAVLLHRMNGALDVEYETRFSDIEDYKWYTDAVIWASAQDVGIVNGVSEGVFGISENITREQMVTMMYRYAQYMGYDVSYKEDISRFSDANKVSSYALEAMQWAVGNGIVVGSDNILDPKGETTRAQCATIIMRFVMGLEDNEDAGDENVPSDDEDIQEEYEITAEEICRMVAAYFNHASGTEDYVAYESECTKTEEGYEVCVRYTGGSEANIIVATVSVNIETGDASDGRLHYWNVYDYE